ncbi:MAG: type VI secretion system-associated protein TagF [Polyangiales bacterium]
MTDPADISASTRSVGFLGKLPARGDFVRQHVSDRVGAELEQWLQKSSQNLYQAKTDLPAQPLRFVFTAPNSQSAAIGTLIKSQDQVGRSFPLAIYTHVPLKQAHANLPALPVAFAQFFAGAEQVLGAAAQLSVEQLRDAVAQVAPSADAQWPQAVDATARALQATDAQSLLAALFQAAPPDAFYYGLYTFCAASGPVRSAPPSSAATVLDCPSSQPVALSAWLDLARRRLAWAQFCPSFVWSEGDAGRLLLSLGAASDQLLHFVVDPKHTSARLWPLISQRADAIARARADLAGVASALSSGNAANIDALWSVVMQVSV